MDRNILRMAIYEMSREDTPAAVVIDEALELARQFSGDESVSFINGVLDAVHGKRSGRGQRIRMNVLMVASEATPFAKTGGLADVLGSLPAGSGRARRTRGGGDARLSRKRLSESDRARLIATLWIPLGPGYLVDIYQTTERGVDFYFVHCRRCSIATASTGISRRLHALRGAVHGGAGRGALPVPARHHALPRLAGRARARVSCASDFALDPTFSGVKVLFTIHNLGYQGVFGSEVMGMVGLDFRLFNPEQLEAYGNVNYMKGGIAWSDAVSTVSKGYAREIQTPEFGFGLDGFLRKHGPVIGILNGVDYAEWNPEHDPHIAGALLGERPCGKAGVQARAAGRTRAASRRT